MKWISVKERLPEPGKPCLVFWPKGEYDWDDNLAFDCIDVDCDDGDSWQNHNEHYDHYLAVACEGMSGPSEKAPYTHWMPLPSPPED